MSKQKKRPLAVARLVAGRLVDALRPHCERVEIAGSIRRQRPLIGDIEVLAIPRLASDLFGQPAQGMPTAVDALLARHDVALSLDGPRLKQFNYGGFKVDLFLQPDPATWGVNMLIRTGSAAFSQWFVTPAWRGGGLPDGFGITGARLHYYDQIVDTPEERDVFRAVGLAYIEPRRRNGAPGRREE